MTDVALKEYFERRLEDLDRRITDRFDLNESAVAKAERTMNERLNSMNEFRDALKDQASRMVTRIEHDKLDAEIRHLQQAQSNLEGRRVVLTTVVSVVVSLISGVVLRFIK
jgi:hypothetical protein